MSSKDIPMRFACVLTLAAALAAVVVPDAFALRFADTPCIEAGPGGVRACPDARVGASYAIKLEGAGGCGPGLPYQFRLLSGALPPGLLLGRDGLISGTPTHAGSWSFWVELSDEDPPSASWCRPTKSERELSIRVAAPPAEVATPYALALGAVGETPHTWSVASGLLPPGLTLDSASGAITGIPGIAGSFPLRLSVLDGKGYVRAVELTITVSPTLVFATTRLAPIRVGDIYRTRLRTSGGVGPVTLSVVSGRFPIGIRLHVNSGLITGKPRKAGVYRITIQARDALGKTLRRTLALTVRPQHR